MTMQKTVNPVVCDVAVAYEDGMATWFVAQSVDAPRKIAFVHTDFVAAGYDTDHERGVYCNFNQICFGSEASRSSFFQCLPEYSSQTAIIPNCVDEEQIQQLSRAGVGFTDDFHGLRLLTVGRLSHEKGMYKIPKLIVRLQELCVPFRWYLIGDGPARVELEKCAQNSEQLVCLGTQTNPYPYIRQCDIYVQPSDYEGYCIALAEARTLCRPSVVCNFSGAQEQLEDGITGVITGFDVEELYHGIALLMCSPDVRAAMQCRLEGKCQGRNEQMMQWIATL